jgi:hypothetical protein
MILLYDKAACMFADQQGRMHADHMGGAGNVLGV